VILALETSCDDTCAAVVTDRGEIRSNVISSQGVHDRFGGVVPEIASRQHLELVNAVVEDALARAGVTLDEIDSVAVTQGPGLVGALLVGLASAKALAAARRLPLTPVDHLRGHVAASFLEPDPFAPPFLCLIASGGHTFLAAVHDTDGPAVSGTHGFELLGSTLDDAAGEAFDKGARLLGLPFPGGPHLERLAIDGDPEAFAFPTGLGRGGRRGTVANGLDFSFAGVKTALLYRVRELGSEAERRRADLAASYQRAIVEALATRVEQGLRCSGLERLAVGGGVAANGPLRERLGAIGVPIKIPPPELCTDNAAMIAGAARFEPGLAYPEYLGLDAYASGQTRPAAVAPVGAGEGPNGTPPERGEPPR
jgi:N6-L-threonylcarbamoyladenine synthase